MRRGGGRRTRRRRAGWRGRRRWARGGGWAGRDLLGHTAQREGHHRQRHLREVPVGGQVDAVDEVAGGTRDRTGRGQGQLVDLAWTHIGLQGHGERVRSPPQVTDGVLPRVDAAWIRFDAVVGQRRLDAVRAEQPAGGLVDLQRGVPAVGVVPVERDLQAVLHRERRDPVGRHAVRRGLVERGYRELVPGTRRRYRRALVRRGGCGRLRTTRGDGRRDDSCRDDGHCGKGHPGGGHPGAGRVEPGKRGLGSQFRISLVG